MICKNVCAFGYWGCSPAIGHKEKPDSREPRFYNTGETDKKRMERPIHPRSAGKGE